MEQKIAICRVGVGQAPYHDSEASFPFVPPPQYVMRPPVTEHVPINSKSLCKIKKSHVCLGGANNMRH